MGNEANREAKSPFGTKTAIAVGTASWTDKTLIASGWYPRELKRAEDRLKHYAANFSLVEVDGTYYALPTPQVSQLWAERTPHGFTFNIKAYRLFTGHQTGQQTFPPDLKSNLRLGDSFYYQDLPVEIVLEMWRRFRDALEPLRRAGKLGAILFQYPPWFVKRRSNIEHIVTCASMLEGFQLAVEFRNNTWFSDRHAESTLRFERDHGLVHVVVDEPQHTSYSIPAIWEVATPRLAMVRLHGRNTETWQAKGLASAAERFDYLYSEEELAALAPLITRLADKAEKTHVIFNNCYGDKGVRNAALLREMLSLPASNHDSAERE
ncbi:MAG: DUF72 domain-containing protein [Burkholderiales bacterium]